MVVGFSDITALHSLMSVHGVVSLHANMCKDISLLPDDDEALVAERAWLTGGDTLLTVECESDLCRNGIAEGKIIGGNLSVLYGLQGTPYDLNTIRDKCDEPPLLFIEDICEKHYHIDRMLQNLRMSGVLNRIAGLVVGQFTDCDDDDTMGCTLLESIRQIVEPYKFPVLFNYPSGHIDSNMPLCFMRKYRLEVQDNKGSLTIL